MDDNKLDFAFKLYIPDESRKKDDSVVSTTSFAGRTDKTTKPYGRRSAQQIDFLQLNLHKSSTASRELTLVIDKLNGKPFIAFVTEPFVSSDKSVNLRRNNEVYDDYKVTCLPKSNLFYNNRKGAAPRTAIFADRSQDLVLDPEYTDRDITTCKWRTDVGTNNLVDVQATVSSDSSSSLTDDEISSFVGSNPSIHDSVDPANNGKTEIYLVSMYWDITKKAPPRKFTKLVEYCSDNSIPIIITMDANAHSPLWHSKDTNPRGEWMEDFILSNDLDVLNDSPEPTFMSGRNKSVIDVSLVSRDIAHYFSNWRNHDRDMSSDHKLLTFEGRFTETPIPARRNVRKADWKLFRTVLDENLQNIVVPEIWDESVIDGLTESLHGAVNRALTQAVPMTTPKNHHKLPWWSEELRKARRVRNRHYKTFRRNPSNHNYAQKQVANRNLRFEYQKASRKYWQSKTSDISDASSMAKLVRGVRKGQYVPPTLLKRDNSYTKSREETLNLLADTHFDESQDVDPATVNLGGDDFVVDDGPHRSYKSSATRVKIVRMPWFHESRINKAIKSFKDYKAPGPCGTQPIVLKNLSARGTELLSWIYSASMTVSYVPRLWRTSKTIFIPKTGKGDYTLPRSYRPITLTSFYFKCMERLVLWKLDTGLFKRYPLHKEQYAFRKGHSTEGALTKTIGLIESAMSNQQMAISLFVDIEGAFDNLSTHAAISAMVNHKLPDEIVKWFSFYLRNRSSTISLNNTGRTKRLIKGTPQGGVLSPILWNLAFDQLLKMISGEPDLEIRGFADDACIVITGDDPKRMEERLQRQLDRVNRWAGWNGLKLSANKTVAMVFNKTKKFEDEIANLRGLRLRDKFRNQPVEYVDQTKYLGLTLDTKLTWREHIRNKTSSAMKLFFMLRKALGTYWGPRPHLIKWIYTGMVRPAITYGCFLWGKASQTKQVQKTFRRINALVLRMMAPQRKNTPISSMEMVTYTKPLHIFIREEVVMAYYRNAHLLTGHEERIRPYGGHIEFAEKCVNLFKVPQGVRWDRGLPEYSLDPKFTVNTASYLEGKPYEPHENVTSCYTDGSKFRGGVGAGVIIYRHHKKTESPEEAMTESSDDKNDSLTSIVIKKESYSLRKYNTVFQAEVAAINEAVSFLLLNRRDNAGTEKTVIMSDSQSTLEALQKTHTRSILVNECIQNLNRLSRSTKVTLQWIKAHKGYEGNEIADELAKTGAAFAPDRDVSGDTVNDDSVEGINFQPHNATAIPLIEAPAPISYLKTIVREESDILWGKSFVAEKYSDGSRKHRQTKHFWVTPDRNKSKAILKLDRVELGYVFQFITGHTRLQRHEKIIADGGGDFTKSSVCTLCDMGDETPIHLVHECGPLAIDAMRIFGDHTGLYNQQGFTLKWYAKDLIKFLRLPLVKNLFSREDQTEEEDEEPPDPGGSQNGHSQDGSVNPSQDVDEDLRPLNSSQEDLSSDCDE